MTRPCPAAKPCRMTKLQVTTLDIEGPLLVRPRRHGDDRGWFCETWNRRDWIAAGLPDIEWVQDNMAFSATAGTLRGLHFQTPPRAQAKLVQAVRGSIYDAMVDLRPGSPTHGRAVGVELNESDAASLYVPAGFAHGYQTLTPDTLVSYKVSDVYAPECEGGLLWKDPDLAIPWPMETKAVLAERDTTWPALAAVGNPFGAPGD